MPQHLTSTQATIPLDWIQMPSKYAPLSCWPISVSCSPDIFESKMSELMAILELMQTYLDDLLWISKSSLDNHLAKLRRVFIRLQNVGLKINAHKSCFCVVGTEYLGYILSRDGFKPQPNKLLAILALTLPQIVKQHGRFLGMVHYRDIWAQWSEMLALLSNLVGESGHTKNTKIKKKRK